MKKILSILSAAAVLFGAASCAKDNLGQIKEAKTVDNPLNTILVKVASDTKLAVDSDNLTPAFEEGDVIFGWDKQENVYAYTCTKVEDGVATFDRTSSGAPSSDEGTLINLVYAPGYDVEDIVEKTLDVNLAVQGETLPVVMHATGEVDAQGECIVEFSNDVAIVDVKDAVLPGAAEGEEYIVTFLGNNTSLKFALSEFGFLNYEAAVEGPISSSVKAAVSADSKISKRFAVPASSKEVEVVILAMAADGSTYGFSTIEKKEIVAGNYIKVTDKTFVPRYVAQIAEDKYMTLAKAVAAANAAGTAEITILEDCTAPAQTIAAGKTVTLDLNGKTIMMNGEAGKFIIDGTMILEDGSVSKSGVLCVDDETCTRAIEVSAGGSLTINGGTVEGPSISSNGHFTVYVGKETGDKASFTMNGGALNGHSQYGTLYARNAQCTLNAGTISGKNNGTNKDYLMARAMFLQADADVTVSEGMNISAESEFGNSHCIHFANKSAKLTANGGVFKAATAIANFGTASGQYIVNGGYFNSEAVGVGKNTGNAEVHAGYYTFEPELIEGGFVATDISANPEVKDGVTYNWKIEKSTIPVATLTVGSGDPQSFTAIDDAYIAAIAQDENSECTIQLLDDCTVESKIDITKKIKLTVDLNGKTLTIFGTNRVNVSCEGAEYIIDDKSGSEGTYQQTSTSNVYISAVTGGKFIVNKGKLTHSGTSSAIYLNTTAGASTITGFEMNGGSIVSTSKECTAVLNIVSDKADVLIKGGSITMTGNTKGYALYLQRGKSLTVEDGTFTSSGMAVRAICADGNVNISGGKFVGDTTALYMTKGNLNITGGEFSVSTTATNGCRWGVIDLMGTSDANLGKVRISNAKVVTDKGHRAFYVRYAPDMEISSGEFSAVRHVVYVGYAKTDNTSLTISGGSFKATGTSSYPVIYNGGESSTRVTGGYFYRTNTTKQLIFQTSTSGNATIELSGGHCNMDPKESVSPADNFVSLADGCIVKDDGEGDYKYYIVKE